MIMGDRPKSRSGSRFGSVEEEVIRGLLSREEEYWGFRNRRVRRRTVEVGGQRVNIEVERN